MDFFPSLLLGQAKPIEHGITRDFCQNGLINKDVFLLCSAFHATRLWSVFTLCEELSQVESFANFND